MILNGVVADILYYFTKFYHHIFGANYVRVIEVRPTLSATKT